jgi:23S rRNA (cytosine1962-C5)-methyltransferase
MTIRRSTQSGSRASNVSPPAEHAFQCPWVRLRSGTAHAFIYRRMLAEVDPAAVPGDVVAVYDKTDRFFGHAFYHDRSQIALRVLSYRPEPVDEGFFRARLRLAIDWRRQLIGEDAATDVYRLVHSEGDSLSGLIAERYGDTIAIEVFSLGVFRQIELFKRLFTELTGIERFVVRADERVEQLEGFQVKPALSTAGVETVTVRERGLRFRVDLRGGHKTGFFADQRDNRWRLGQLARGREMLDVCCYTGGFGIYAAKLGAAAEVTGVDLDEKAIDLARKNANLNDLRMQHVHADAFGYMRQMQTNGRAYDVVVLDPPKFVAGREDFYEGGRKYVDLNTLGMTVLRPGGLLLTCSCSGSVSLDDFLGMVKAAANRVRRPLQVVDITGASPDHPVMANAPESEYLKAVWARVL